MEVLGQSVPGAKARVALGDGLSVATALPRADVAMTVRPTFRPPLVSVVIVNYNYAAFLAEAVESVFDQTYREVECIVLDNASTDESGTVLDDLVARYPDLRVVRRAANDGQCVACAEGFFATRGDYVVFLDADDVLLADFVSTHVAVHLAARIPVGFTCSDMLQSHGDRLVLGTFVALNEFVRSGAGRRTDLLRPTDTAFAASLPAIDPDCVHYAGPERTDWPWASTSAFLFRRTALAQVLDNPALTTLSCALDVYLARGLNVLYGSLVIDRALTIYRMHTRNIYAKHAQLANWFNYERGGDNDQERRARMALLDNLLARADQFLARIPDRNAYARALRILDRVEPRLHTSSGRSYAGQALLDHFQQLRAIVGLKLLLLWALRLGVVLPGLGRAIRPRVP